MTVNGTNVFARIPGTDLTAETVMVSTSYSSTAKCGTQVAPIACPGATEHAASTALVLELATTLAAAIDHFKAVVMAEPCDAHLAPEPFTDMRDGSYATADVSLLFDLGITTGTSPTTYSPNNVVTREQMASFIARVWRLVHPDAAPVDTHPFIDINPVSFAAEDIHLIWQLGITRGTGPDTYDPSGLVTRRQMAAFLSRLLLLLHPGMEPGGEHPFTDIDLEGYAEPHIALIYALGITTGTTATTYSPGDVVTREQMAAFLGRLIRALTPSTS